MKKSKSAAAARESALQAAWQALERVLTIGLTELEQPSLDLVRRRVTEDGCQVEITVLMGSDARLVCSVVTPDLVQRAEIFRIEFDIERELHALQ
jgi:hypothetical protein